MTCRSKMLEKQGYISIADVSKNSGINVQRLRRRAIDWRMDVKTLGNGHRFFNPIDAEFISYKSFHPPGSALDYNTKNKIVELFRADPGLSKVEIATICEVHSSTVYKVIDEYLQHSAIVMQSLGNYIVY